MDLQDGNWTREEKMSASLRDTDEPHLVFRFEQLLTMLRFRLMSLFATFCCIFVAASEHLGQTAMVSRCHQRECESQLSWQPAVA